jgi:alkylation response protein AidB-like acyl-CoA dehydrogenase
MTITTGMREVDGRLLAPAEVGAFRDYVRSWLPEGLPRSGEEGGPDEALEAMTARHRLLQRRLWDGGLAGILYPVEYGGLGLSREHQQVFVEEAAAYETPGAFSVSHGILVPTLLDFGTEEQKSQYIPASLRGDEMWVQLLSEPSGGSDMAGVLTRAVRDGDTYVVNGSKIWSTFAHVADLGMLLCRTNPEAPKHRGLSMLIVPLVNGNGLTIRPIRLATGDSDFCEEFFDDLSLPAANLVGREHDGWSVASKLLFHERNLVGDNSMNDTRSRRREDSSGRDQIVALAQRLGVTDDPVVRQLVGEALTVTGLMPYARERINDAMTAGTIPGPGASLLKLMSALVGYRRDQIAVEVAGAHGVVWDAADDAGSPGIAWLGARIGTIAGGSNEMQRNVVSERVLALPREYSPDKDRPFSEVRHNN